MPRVWLVNYELDGHKGSQVTEKEPVAWFVESRARIVEIGSTKKVQLIGSVSVEFRQNEGTGVYSIKDFDDFIEEEKINGLNNKQGKGPNRKQHKPNESSPVT